MSGRRAEEGRGCVFEGLMLPHGRAPQAQASLTALPVRYASLGQQLAGHLDGISIVTVRS